MEENQNLGGRDYYLAFPRAIRPLIVQLYKDNALKPNPHYQENIFSAGVARQGPDHRNATQAFQVTSGRVISAGTTHSLAAGQQAKFNGRFFRLVPSVCAFCNLCGVFISDVCVECCYKHK